MSVYIDNTFIPFGRMKMSHMIADTTDELLEMADKISVKRKWIQYPGTAREHFDISASKRLLAIKNGAVSIETVQLSCMIALRQLGYKMGDPETAKQRYLEILRSNRIL